jgi:hypothetical protein
MVRAERLRVAQHGEYIVSASDKPHIATSRPGAGHWRFFPQSTQQRIWIVRERF